MQVKEAKLSTGEPIHYISMVVSKSDMDYQRFLVCNHFRNALETGDTYTYIRIFQTLELAQSFEMQY